MLKIKNTTDLNALIRHYGFKRIKGVHEYLLYTDKMGNEIIVLPGKLDGLINVFINAPKVNERVLIDITDTGVMSLIARLFKNGMIFIEEEK